MGGLDRSEFMNRGLLRSVRIPTAIGVHMQYIALIVLRGTLLIERNRVSASPS